MKCKGGWFDEVLEVLMNLSCVPTSSFSPLVISLKAPGNQIHPMTMQAHTMVSFSHVHNIKTWIHPIFLFWEIMHILPIDQY